jgi:methionyl-tRNA formyltransferase
LRLLFFGTPGFAVPSLAALLERGHEIAAVVTQPDRPAGRGQETRTSAVKELALARGLVVEQPPKLREPAVAERIRALAPEAIVVAAYGKILPKVLLEIPPRGAINVHGSLLPSYRGAAPIQRALLAGDATTGITIMQMNERMDAGDILLQGETPIAPDDTSESLGRKLAILGGRLLVETLERLAKGTLSPRPQVEADATLAPMVQKEEGAVDWRRSAREIERAVRAFTPWPSAYTSLRGKLLKIHRAVVRPLAAAAPGTVVRATCDDLEVATGDGALALVEVQLEGKRRLGAREFLAGKPLREGDVLGDAGEALA